MGVSYFKDLRWAEITREERFFCQHLYQYFKSGHISEFLSLIEKNGIIVQKQEFVDIGFEVCFYRDYTKRFEIPLKGFSPKRTFDLALFMEEAIFIIEAKAQQGHTPEQVTSFLIDRDQVRKITEISHVYLVSITSSKYPIPDGLRQAFDAHLTWSEIASVYNNDNIFKRADEVYGEKAPFAGKGKNKTGNKTGTELVFAYQKGEKMWVGRQENLKGVSQDIGDGSWKNKSYEVNTTDDTPPNSSWFSLDDFISVLRIHGISIS